MAIQTYYEIKQLVKTVKGSRLEVIEKYTWPNSGERLARQSYADLVRDNPDEHFVLVKVQHAEECLLRGKHELPNL